MAIVVCTIKFNLVMESVTRKGREDCNRSFAIPWPFSFMGGVKMKLAQLSRDEVEDMERDLTFAMGVLELFHGVENDTVMNSKPVLLEAENRLYRTRERLAEVSA